MKKDNKVRLIAWITRDQKNQIDKESKKFGSISEYIRNLLETFEIYEITNK